MSSIYGFDIDSNVEELLPSDYRLPVNIKLVQSLLSALKWVRDLFFDSYFYGNVPAKYAAGTYAYLDQVTYKKKVYLSLIDGNTDAPTTSNWLLVQDDFLGLKERMLYNGSRLSLEYALNRKFETTFRQPATPSGVGDAKSDIYFEAGTPTSVGFLIGATEPKSSSVGKTKSSGYIGSDSPLIYAIHFNIKVPSATMATIGATLQEQTTTISNFVRQYLPTSINFGIIAY